MKKNKKLTEKHPVKIKSITTAGNLVSDIHKMIGETRSSVAATVNIGLTMLYWKIGKRVNDEILVNKRAGYGEEILATLSQELIIEHGSSFSEKNLRRMVQFSEVFSDEKIVVSLIRQLSWTHFIALIPLKKPLEREFYAEMCRVERWSVRTLRKKIDSMLFERTALSKKPEKLARMELSKLREEDKLTPDLVFRDPYFLDFLGLKGSYQEKDLESAILREIEAFIMELGAGFSFVARQKRITIDNDDFYIDLLFYHRKLKSLVVIDLKLGKFKAAYKGQMELYLRWLEKYETEPGEQPPLGLILCAEGNNGQVELLQLDKSGIHVAEYLTVLPPKKLLQEKLHKAIGLAKRQIEQRNTNKEKK
ncbi:MAG: cytoplasmic protein [Elusimicrobia bacterium HGW-Elusimicrobia-2]|nr:MAG: cytoplasmic protein [Elusimicrobia bacterium HGW-Elusimicrobia-2]